jgi:anti-anti-sigma regulatory factor
VRSKVAVSTEGRFAVSGDLDFDARHEFTAEAFAAIISAAAAGTQVAVDCSAVDPAAKVDASVLGMLVTLGRSARRKGSRLVLAHASKPMRAQLEAAGVAQFFDWKR